MTSWQALLRLHLTQGRYLSTREPTEYDWWMLWALGVWVVGEVNSSSQPETKDPMPEGHGQLLTPYLRRTGMGTVGIPQPLP